MTMTCYQDGEVLRLSEVGTVVQWNAEDQCEYDCGETPEEFGVENLTNIERERLGI
jgi:hypothetical protein